MSDSARHRLLSSVRGLVQGVYYGTKIRMPHALVMTLLFRKGPLSQKVRNVASLTFQHARNLGSFVLIYKSVNALARFLLPTAAAPGLPAHPLVSLVAAGAGGWLVWANYSSVNYQVALYLFSRIIIAIVRLASERGVPVMRDLTFKRVYPYFATGVWAVVLYLFEYHPHTLHPSLARSMTELYHDANSWSSWKDFAPTPAAAAVIAYIVTSQVSQGKPLRDLLDISKKI